MSIMPKPLCTSRLTSFTCCFQIGYCVYNEEYFKQMNTTGTNVIQFSIVMRVLYIESPKHFWHVNNKLISLKNNNNMGFVLKSSQYKTTQPRSSMWLNSCMRYSSSRFCSASVVLLAHVCVWSPLLCNWGSFLQEDCDNGVGTSSLGSALFVNVCRHWALVFVYMYAFLLIS